MSFHSSSCRRQIRSCGCHGMCSNSDAGHRRRGLATVEFAVCVPVLVTLVFGAIEASNAIYLKNSLTSAAYETARTVTATGGTQSAAENRFNEIVAARGIDGAVLNITPSVDSLTPAGAVVEVRATAPASANSYAPSWFFKDSDMSAHVVMVRQ